MRRSVGWFGLVVTLVPSVSPGAQERLGSGEKFSGADQAQVISQDPSPGPIAPAIVGGIIGSAAGAGAGYLMGSGMTAGCSHDDCDTGGAVGWSWVGAAIGAHAGTARAGGDPNMGRAIFGSALGILGGFFSSIIITNMNTETTRSPVPYVIAWTAIQGTVAGLVTAAGR